MDAFYLQWIGCAFGVLGALLLALNNRLSGWGFVSFLASNVCWIGFGVMTDAPGLIFMQVAFTATSLLGIYRWMLVKPSAVGRVPQVPLPSQDFRARKFWRRVLASKRLFNSWLLRGYCVSGIASFKDLMDSLRNGSVLSLCMVAFWLIFKHYAGKEVVLNGLSQWVIYMLLPVVFIIFLGFALMFGMVFCQALLLVDRIPILKLRSRRIAIFWGLPIYASVCFVFLWAPFLFLMGGFIRL